MNYSKYKYHLLLHFTVFIFGFTGIFGKLITIDAVPLVWYRMLIAAIALAFFLLIMRKGLHTSFKKVLKIFGIGLVIAAHWIFFYQSIKISTVCVKNGGSG